jgi:tRNA threonylcarbamoyladenosine biosynthesis protein TsaB
VNILSVETSSDACSCALLRDGELIERFVEAPRRHTALLLPMVESVLAEAQLALGAVDLLAYGCGPGSFTGVRIASSTVQGLAMAVDRPVRAVSSLATVAMVGGCPGEAVLAAFDARMGEVYLGTFQIGADGLAVPRGAEQLAAPGSVALPGGGDWVGVGGGWAAHGKTLRGRLGSRLVDTRSDPLPRAGAVARLAAADTTPAGPAAIVTPRYLRRDVATPKASRET